MISKIFTGSLLVAAVCTAQIAQAGDFSYKSLITAGMKLTPEYDYENYVDSYMQVFRAPVWQKSSNDEFELNAKRSETIEIMKKTAAAYNLEDPITIHTSVEFGEYNFKEKKFDLSPFNATTFFYENNCCTKLPNTMRVFFTNPEIVDGLPMETDTAKAFLAKHKSNGYVNRRLEADVIFKLKSLRSDTDLDAEIIKVVVKDQVKGNPVILVVP